MAGNLRERDFAWVPAVDEDAPGAVGAPASDLLARVCGQREPLQCALRGLRETRRRSDRYAQGRRRGGAVPHVTLWGSLRFSGGLLKFNGGLLRFIGAK
eukprot:8210615-Pyramimonas_sp.AAC.1